MRNLMFKLYPLLQLHKLLDSFPLRTLADGSGIGDAGRNSKLFFSAYRPEFGDLVALVCYVEVQVSSNKVFERL